MSSFGFLNITGVDGSTSGGGGGGGLPGGINGSVQFNDGGITFGGTSNFLYDSATQQMTATKIKPGVIVDSTNSVGTAGQVLSSTGTALQYITPAVVNPGGVSGDIQFNNGGVFDGDSTFTFSPIGVGLELVTVPFLDVRDDIQPIVNATGSVGTVAKRFADVHSTNATHTNMKSTSIIDSTNNAGITGAFLGNVGGNTLWQTITLPNTFKKAQFNSNVVQTVGPGSNSIIFQTETFINGVQLTLPPPVQFFEVLTSGVYLVTHNVTFKSNGPGNNNVDSFVRRVAPPLDYARQRVIVHNNEYGIIGNSEMIQLDVGSVYAINLTSISNLDISFVNVVVQSMFLV